MMWNIFRYYFFLVSSKNKLAKGLKIESDWVLKYKE